MHAIWPGSVLLETQQNCDLTYRMYDYGRPRELHIEKSLEATKLVTRAGKVATEGDGGPDGFDRRGLFSRGADSSGRRPIEREPAARTGTSSGLAYLFAAAGAGRIAGPGFDAVDLPARGIVAVPACRRTLRWKTLADWT